MGLGSNGRAGGRSILEQDTIFFRSTVIANLFPGTKSPGCRRKNLFVFRVQYE